MNATYLQNLRWEHLNVSDMDLTVRLLDEKTIESVLADCMERGTIEGNAHCRRPPTTIQEPTEWNLSPFRAHGRSLIKLAMRLFRWLGRRAESETPFFYNRRVPDGGPAYATLEIPIGKVVVLPADSIAGIEFGAKTLVHIKPEYRNSPYLCKTGAPMPPSAPVPPLPLVSIGPSGVAGLYQKEYEP